MSETQLTPPFSIPQTIEHAKRRGRELTDIFKQRFWSPPEKQEALTLAEYLEARK